MTTKPGRGNRTDRRGHRQALSDDQRANIQIRVTKATHAALLERRHDKETINDVIARLLDERGNNDE